jgi:hypothetical protein
MKKYLFIVVLILLVLCACQTNKITDLGEQAPTISITNTTGGSISTVRVRPSGTSYWGDNLIIKELEDSYSINITLPYPLSEQSLYDIQLSNLESENTFTKLEIDITLTTTIVFDENDLDNAMRNITMTTEAMSVTLRIGGSGFVVIDWGDGREVIKMMDFDFIDFGHTYENSGAYKIVIHGDVTYLDGSRNRLIGFDAENNSLLSTLNLKNNKLTNLYLTENTALYEVDVSANRFTTDGLNNLFHTLHSEDLGVSRKRINIKENFGTHISVLT